MVLNLIALVLGVLALLASMIECMLYRTAIKTIIEELNSNIINGNVEDTVYNNGFNWGLLKAIDIVSKYK